MSTELADLYQQTAIKLELVRAEQNVSAEDGAIIARYYLALHDQLLSEGLVTWKNDEAVPDWSAPIIVDMLAAMLVDEFGLEEPRRSIVKMEGVLSNNPVSPAERKLRRQVAQPYISSPIRTEDF